MPTGDNNEGSFERWNRRLGQYEIVGADGSVISSSGSPQRENDALGGGRAILEAGKAALRAVFPGAAVADAVVEHGGESASNILAAFNPVRWIAGAAGIALIIGGIVVSVKSGD